MEEAEVLIPCGPALGKPSYFRELHRKETVTHTRRRGSAGERKTNKAIKGLIEEQA